MVAPGFTLTAQACSSRTTEKLSLFYQQWMGTLQEKAKSNKRRGLGPSVKFFTKEKLGSNSHHTYSYKAV